MKDDAAARHAALTLNVEQLLLGRDNRGEMRGDVKKHLVDRKLGCVCGVGVNVCVMWGVTPLTQVVFADMSRPAVTSSPP